MDDVRDSVHDDFKRNGNLLLDLFGGYAGPLGDDFDVIVGDVGVGFDGKLMERDGAPDEQQESCSEDEKAVVEREIYESANHFGGSCGFCAAAADGATPGEMALAAKAGCRWCE